MKFFHGADPIRAGDWAVLRVMDVDGAGGFAAVEMVKYTEKG